MINENMPYLVLSHYNNEMKSWFVALKPFSE
jgi:hypothetical protein